MDMSREAENGVRNPKPTLAQRSFIGFIWAMTWIMTVFALSRSFERNLNECIGAIIVTSVFAVPMIMMYVTYDEKLSVAPAGWKKPRLVKDKDAPLLGVKRSG